MFIKQLILEKMGVSLFFTDVYYLLYGFWGLFLHSVYIYSYTT